MQIEAWLVLGLSLGLVTALLFIVYQTRRNVYLQSEAAVSDQAKKALDVEERLAALSPHDPEYVKLVNKWVK